MSSSTTYKKYYVHRNVGDTITRLYNYYKDTGESYQIIYRELKRTGMDHGSVMVIDQLHRNKRVHRICHSPSTAYKLAQQLPRRLIVHMTTGEYLDISTIDYDNIIYSSLSNKLQPISVKSPNNDPMICFVVPRPSLSNR